MVIVVSGIPFWTTRPIQPGATPPPPADNKARPRIRFASGPGVKALMEMKDFLLFKDTNDQVISEGFFDNNWKLPANAAKSMKDSGAIDMKQLASGCSRQ
jgi:hypothetical protein